MNSLNIAMIPASSITLVEKLAEANPFKKRLEDPDPPIVTLVLPENIKCELLKKIFVPHVKDRHALLNLRMLDDNRWEVSAWITVRLPKRVRLEHEETTTIVKQVGDKRHINKGVAGWFDVDHVVVGTADDFKEEKTTLLMINRMMSGYAVIGLSHVAETGQEILSHHWHAKVRKLNSFSKDELAKILRHSISPESR